MNLKDVGVMTVTLHEFIAALNTKGVVVAQTIEEVDGSITTSHLDADQVRTLINDFVKSKLIASLKLPESLGSCTICKAPNIMTPWGPDCPFNNEHTKDNDKEFK